MIQNENRKKNISTFIKSTATNIYYILDSLRWDNVVIMDHRHQTKKKKKLSSFVHYNLASRLKYGCVCVCERASVIINTSIICGK